MHVAYLQWASPWLAVGLLAAAGLPVLAHLFSRRGGRVTVFPTVRFIARAVEEGRRRARPRDLILMLLRCLVLALLVAAFARPVWYSAQPLAQGVGVHAVYVLDRSASMRREHQGAMLFEHARRAIAAAIDTLDPASDLATVVLLDHSPTLLLAEPTANLSLLQQRLAEVQPSFERGDAAAALQLAAALSRASNGPAQAAAPPGRRAIDEAVRGFVARATRIEIFSDMQHTQWLGVPSASPVDGGGVAAASVRLHPLGGAADNLAVSNPRLAPNPPIAGQPATLRVDVADYSPHIAAARTSGEFAPSNQASRAVRLRLEWQSGDGRRSQADQTLRLGAGAATTASFTLQPARPGPAQVTVQLLAGPGDGLTADNSTGLFFHVRSVRPVAMVTSASTDDASTAAYYLARALKPGAGDAESTGDAEGLDEASAVALAVSPPAELAGPWLTRRTDKPALLFLVHAGELEARALEHLRRYLAEGGGVVWVIDSPAAAASLRAFAHVTSEPSDAAAMAPIVPDASDAWRSAGSTAIATARFDHPILDAFQGPSRSALLDVRFTRRVHGSLSPSAQELLSFHDDSPALAVQWQAAGRLAVLAADLSPDASDFVKGPAFVPLVHQLVRRLTPGPPAPPNAQPGESAALALEGAHAAETFAVIGPDGGQLSSAAITRDDRTTVQLPTLALPGPYVLRRHSDGSLLAGAHVDIASQESDLRSADDGHAPSPGVDQAGPVLASNSRRDGELAATTAPLPGKGVELWPWLALAALALSSVELMLATLRGRWPERFTRMARAATAQGGGA